MVLVYPISLSAPSYVKIHIEFNILPHARITWANYAFAALPYRPFANHHSRWGPKVAVTCPAWSEHFDVVFLMEPVWDVHLSFTTVITFAHFDIISLGGWCILTLLQHLRCWNTISRKENLEDPFWPRPSQLEQLVQTLNCSENHMFFQPRTTAIKQSGVGNQDSPETTPWQKAPKQLAL